MRENRRRECTRGKTRGSSRGNKPPPPTHRGDEANENLRAGQRCRSGVAGKLQGRRSKPSCRAVGLMKKTVGQKSRNGVAAKNAGQKQNQCVVWCESQEARSRRRRTSVGKQTTFVAKTCLRPIACAPLDFPLHSLLLWIVPAR